MTKKTKTKKPSKAAVYAQLVGMLENGANAIKPLIRELEPNAVLTVKRAKKQVTVTLVVSID